MHGDAKGQKTRYLLTKRLCLCLWTCSQELISQISDIEAFKDKLDIMVPMEVLRYVSSHLWRCLRFCSYWLTCLLILSE